jgi:hypothetical protein
MHVAGSPSLVGRHNDKSALPLAMIAAGSASTNLRSNLLMAGPNRRKALRGEHEYHAALTERAVMHATWWGLPLSADVERWELAWDFERGCAIEEARRAILEIGDATWGARLLPVEQISAWLRLLDNPGDVVSILDQMPQTLIYGDDLIGNPFERPGHNKWQVVSGPAPYDLARFYSSSRWWYGRLPVGRIEMRNWYLERLNERLGAEDLDRYTFDLGFDAALAWRFATRWLPFIAENHTTLLATATYLKATVIEPAWASLRRCS